MCLRFRPLSGLLVLVATMSFPMVATAETETSNYQTPNDVIERAYFKNDPNFYRNQGLRRDINFLLGPGSIFRNSYPETEIARDAELVNTVYQDVLQQQVSNDPYIRTPDLPNPYNSSLLMSPGLNAEKLRTGTEFRFETGLPR